MRTSVYILLAVILLGASLWFFYRTGQFLADQDYLAGLIHVFVGFAVIRTGADLARLSNTTAMEAEP